MQQKRIAQQFSSEINEESKFFIRVLIIAPDSYYVLFNFVDPVTYLWNHLANLQQKRMAQEFENQPQNRAKRFAGALDILRRILAPGADDWRPNIPYVILTQNQRASSSQYSDYDYYGEATINENGRIDENDYSYYETRPGFGEARKK